MDSMAAMTGTKKGDTIVFYVYVLLCRRGRKLSFYTGYTKNLMDRIKLHITGKGAKYLRANKVKKLYYIEKYRTRRKAMRREFAIKKLSHREKAKLIENDYDVDLVRKVNKKLGLA